MSLKQNSQHFARFKDLPWFEFIRQAHIFIGGAGGIGSHLCFMLSRAGAKSITIVDNDVVDEVNLAGQLFGKADVGKTKVEAIFDVCVRLCGEVNIAGIQERIEKDDAYIEDLQESADIVCVAFDNIATRRVMFENWRKSVERRDVPSLFIDGRMSAENGQVFVVPSNKPEWIEAYEKTLFDDSEVEDQPCSAKATTHCGSYIASVMTASIANWINNVACEQEKSEWEGQLSLAPRELVFEQSFHFPVMLFLSQAPRAVTTENVEQL